jgi:hypothetical protein
MFDLSAGIVGLIMIDGILSGLHEIVSLNHDIAVDDTQSVANQAHSYEKFDPSSANAWRKKSASRLSLRFAPRSAMGDNRE